MSELKPELIKASATEVIDAFLEAASSNNIPITVELITTIVAQSALETGHWAYMYNYNFGNVKATNNWIASGGHYTFFDKKPPHAPAPVSENLTKAEVDYWMKQAKPRTDGEPGLDMKISHKRGDGTYCCYFWASHVQTRFRAFKTLKDGANKFLNKLSGKFKNALSHAKVGDIAGYVATLKGLRYFTAPMYDSIVNGKKRPGYLSSVKYLYKLYLPKVKEIMSNSKDTSLLNSDLPDDDVFRTKSEHIEIHKSGWIELSTGVKVTRLPLMDSSIPGRAARIGFAIAENWLKPLGYRLLTAAEYEELNELSIYIAPYCMPTIAQCKAAGIPLVETAINRFRTAHMMSSAWCDFHDKHVWDELKKLNWDDNKPVVNFGKHWAAPAGCIYGWWYKSGKRIQNLSRFHANEPTFADYATNVFAACDPDVGHSDTDPAPEEKREDYDPSMTHGERAVAWTLERVGVAENPLGSNRGPEVCAWLKPCVRDGYGSEFGEYLAKVGANWCAGACCAAEAATRLSTDPPAVHAYRCSGIEMENDAKACGAWHGIDEVFAGTWEPAEGDIAILKSGNQAWRRHVTRFIERENDDTYRATGGNESNKVSVSGGRRFDDPNLLGFIELPRIKENGEPENYDVIKRAVKLEKDLWNGIVGMDAYDELLREMEEADPRDDGE